MPKTYTSENQVYAVIKKRFSSPEYATLPGVRNASGFGATRTIDAMIMGLWPSRGLLLHGVEIKVSRGDWLRELRDPRKQEDIFKRCDRFWLAIGDPDIVQLGEVPETWGLLVPHRGGTLKIKKQAPELTPDAPLSRSFLAALLRRADASMRDPELENRVRAELETSFNASLKLEKERLGRLHMREKYEWEEKLRHATEFETKAGIQFKRFAWNDGIAELIKLDREHDGLVKLVDSLVARLTHVHRTSEILARDARGGLESLGKLHKQEMEETTHDPTTENLHRGGRIHAGQSCSSNGSGAPGRQRL